MTHNVGELHVSEMTLNLSKPPLPAVSINCHGKRHCLKNGGPRELLYKLTAIRFGWTHSQKGHFHRTTQKTSGMATFVVCNSNGEQGMGTAPGQHVGQQIWQFYLQICWQEISVDTALITKSNPQCWLAYSPWLACWAQGRGNIRNTVKVATAWKANVRHRAALLGLGRDWRPTRRRSAESVAGASHQTPACHGKTSHRRGKGPLFLSLELLKPTPVDSAAVSLPLFSSFVRTGRKSTSRKCKHADSRWVMGTRRSSQKHVIQMATKLATFAPQKVCRKVAFALVSCYNRGCATSRRLGGEEGARIDPKLLEILVCPLSKTPLRLVSSFVWGFFHPWLCKEKSREVLESTTWAKRQRKATTCGRHDFDNNILFSDVPRRKFSISLCPYRRVGSHFFPLTLSLLSSKSTFSPATY